MRPVIHLYFMGASPRITGVLARSFHLLTLTPRQNAINLSHPERL